MSGTKNLNNHSDNAGIRDEKIVSFSMILVFLLVIITGIVSYVLLNQSLNSISRSIQPDRRLLLTKNIFNELKEGENAVKSFSLSQHDEYLKSFYLSVQNTEKHLDLLRSGIQQNDTLTHYLDSLELLIEERFLLLDSLLEIQDEYRVQQALNNLVSTIHKDSLQFWQEENDGFFKRLFKGKKKKAEEEALRQAEIEAFSQGVNEIRREEILREQEIRQKELELIGRDRQLMDKVSALLSVFDRAVISIMEEKTALAGKRTRQISWVIGAFVFLASLLLIIAIYTIIRFIRRNNRYKEALQLAHEEALTLARTRESFLANMSHEIRTPMNVISGFTGQLLKGKMTQQQREQLRMIKNASGHLVHILNDILDFSRLEAGKMSLHEKSFVLEDITRRILSLSLNRWQSDKSNILSLQDGKRCSKVC
ncbi:MAG: histidine kinase dimerization/phospho-acceptor domain-containing protein [Bacteroidota bacterium]|nr:histidine kinase dimerization/phospho-acceptor domain-containing protein [Bacteroidota bacterium]